MKGWFVPPIVIPILIAVSLVGFVSLTPGFECIFLYEKAVKRASGNGSTPISPLARRTVTMVTLSQARLSPSQAW